MSRRVVVAVVAVAVVAACYFESLEGRPCTTSNDCDIRRHECIAVDDDAVCLPIIPHEQTTCAVDADCADALFPVEAACEGGLCRCRLTPCAGAGLEIVDRVHCVCVPSEGKPDEFCNDDDDCEAGLHCEQSKCTLPNRAHDACRADPGCAGGLQCTCVDFSCTARECLVEVNGACTENADCASGSCDDFGSGTCL